jgi:putative DNA methylase
VGRLTVWEVTQHLIRRLDQKGEKETANLKAKIGGMAEIARDLAYRLYTLCERKGWGGRGGLLQQPRGRVAVHDVGCI